MASQGPELGQMLSLLSHELRSPLGVMRGYLRLLDQQPTALSATHREAVAAALRASERCLELLAQASALAQIWRQEAPIARMPLALTAVLAPLAQAVHATTDQRLPVAVAPSPELQVSGDSRLLRTALSSLVVSVHRAQPEPLTVDVSASAERRDERDGVAILIAPRGDTAGAGADAPLDLRRGGLGLELPMAAAIIEAHGGSVHERRAPNARMSVVVWFPTS